MFSKALPLNFPRSLFTGETTGSLRICTSAKNIQCLTHTDGCVQVSLYIFLFLQHSCSCFQKQRTRLLDVPLLEITDHITLWKQYFLKRIVTDVLKPQEPNLLSTLLGVSTFRTESSAVMEQSPA